MDAFEPRPSLRDEFTTVFAQRTQGVAVALLVREQPPASQP